MGKVFKALSKAQSDQRDGESQKGLHLEGEPSDKECEKDDGALLSGRSAMPDPVSDQKNSIGVGTSPLQDHTNDGSLERWDEKVRLLLQDPVISESFRQIRNKILVPNNKRPLRTILVASAEREAGKSLITACLGYYLSQGLDDYALLVDCDLRLPTLADLFGVGNDVGLADYLQGLVGLEHLIRKTGLEKLTILPGGTRPGNPAELIGSKKMVETIEELVGRYQDRLVVLDTPPMYAASETANLCKFVDGVLLVVKYEGIGRDKVRELVQEIGKDKIIGIIFNGVQTTVVDKLLGPQAESTAY